MNLSKNFTFKELTRTSTGLPNIPDPETAKNLVALANKLEEIRAVVGPIRVTSGYRSKAVNEAVGGSKTSDHSKGLAADMNFTGNLGAIFRKIKDSGIKVDQLILEPTWIHVGIGPRMRQQYLIAKLMDSSTRRFKYVPFQ
jgi:uncharacterized protein YcbK (DUF882 family)